MTSLGQTRLFRLFEHVPRGASAVAIAVGSLVLFGWVFNLALLKSVFSGLVAMKANTAVERIKGPGSKYFPHSPSQSQLALPRIVGGINRAWPLS